MMLFNLKGGGLKSKVNFRDGKLHRQASFVMGGLSNEPELSEHNMSNILPIMVENSGRIILSNTEGTTKTVHGRG